MDPSSKSFVLAGREAAEHISSDLPPARRGFYPGLTRQREGRWGGPFFFIHLTDIQFGMFHSDESWAEETALFSRAVEAINRLAPRFVVMGGDMVNQGPGGPAHAAELAEFRRVAAQIDSAIPLLCLCGNHDVGNRPTAAALAVYHSEFGADWFSFWCGGICGVVINTCLYWDPSGAPEAQACQERWFARRLRSARAAGAQQVLVFQHHPWFLRQPDDPDEYFTIPRRRRDRALALMRRAGVRAAFAGHYHRNAHGWDGDLEMITTSALGRPLGQDPSGLRIVKVYEDRIEHAYHGLNEVPEEVRLDAP